MINHNLFLYDLILFHKSLPPPIKDYKIRNRTNYDVSCDSLHGTMWLSKTVQSLKIVMSRRVGYHEQTI